MRLFVFLLLLVLFAPLSTAVGYSPPSQREFLFEPNKQFEVELGVTGSSVGVSLNSEQEEILQYVRLEDPAPNSGGRTVKIIFDLPAEMDPGLYGIDIYISERPAGGGVVSATATAKLRLRLRVLSDEKFIEIRSIRIPSIAEGLRANATIDVISRTMQPIDRIYAVVRVYEDGRIVAEDTTGVISLLSAESGTLFATLGTEHLGGGEYDVNASVHYDGKQAETGTAILKVGTLHVEVTGHTDVLIYNATNKFLLNLSNQWNRALRDVHAYVRVGDQQKKTPSQDIDPFGTTEYEVYFDRDDSIGPGQVPVNITVVFNDLNPRTGSYQAREEQFARTVDVARPVVEESSLLTNPMTYVAFAIALLVLLWVVFRGRRHEER